MRYPHLAALLFGQAHMIEPDKLDVILHVLAGRMDVPLHIEGHIAEIRANPSAHKAGAGIAARTGDAWVDVGGGVAVLPVTGTLVHRASGIDAMSGLASYASLSSSFDAMLANSQISHIVLDLNSPGGSTSGAFDFADQVYNARGRKPITAIVDDSAYSAAYLIASAADEIVVSRTGGVGSIGVVAAHMDRSASNDAAGIKVTYVYAGDRKIDGNANAPLSDEAHAALQGEVDRLYGMFVDTVARNRGLSTAAVRDTKAALYRGPSALQSRLADRMEVPRDALRSIVANHQPSAPNQSGRIQRAATAARIRATT